ncbi:MAG TPA: hypothetical protein PKL49_06695 [Steroidobacteraceae bacterium]|nr:hypothetical protein [Steroidobacteraceae bacterium]HNS26559.1 hypothetical protein [Steroidobacteraceae bacterium]
MNEHERKVASPGELPQEIPPARDLWPGIAAAIGAADDVRAVTAPLEPARRRFAVHPLLGLAAAISCVAVGMWLGRVSAPPVTVAAAPGEPGAAPGGAAPVPAASLALDARFDRAREELLRDVAERLAALPPESRAKVEASLADLQRARTDIEAALGRDPGNALLQAMLVNSYQDEMRVLAAVRDTWGYQEDVGA